jgi:hypothetical protein
MRGNVAVATWQSRGGKYTATLYRDSLGYTYKGNGCLGNLGPFASDAAAIEAMQSRMDSGFFQADANTTPMRRM